jgi:hypothetical protein
MGMPSLRWISAAAAVGLLAACGSSADGGASSASGAVTGVVYAAPSCPVQPVDSPCPRLPVAGAEVVAFQSQHRRASTHTGNDGRFRLDLAYGHYTIRATNVGGYGSTTTTEVDISATPVSIELTVDSGIR